LFNPVKARERERASSLTSMTISSVRKNRPVPQRFLLVNVIVPDRKMTSNSAYFVATVIYEFPEAIVAHVGSSRTI
jgi:predicted short-subunit dehydrogenase-like oxidoreductase (DUF2520 family)